jgi:hypothetical protein
MSVMPATAPPPAGSGGDLAALRRAGVLEGYGPTEHVHQRARRRAWRRLAGLDGDAGPTATTSHGPRRRVPHQIGLDVARAFAYPACREWDADTRAAKLAQLADVLAAVFPEDDASSPPASPPPRLRYYQGLHDVASLLLVAAGPVHAPALLTHVLLRGGLLPYARGDAGVPLALDALALMMALLARVDAPLHDHVVASGVAPHWGLSWLLTLFAHDVGDAGAGIRLLDGFLGAGHPALPVYAAVALLMAARAGVLALDPEDTGPFHAHLKRLPAAAVATADDAGRLLDAAAALYRAVPPRALLTRAAWDAGSGSDAAGYARLRAGWPELWTGGPLAGGADPLLLPPGGEAGVLRRWLPLADVASGWLDALAGGGGGWWWWWRTAAAGKHAPPRATWWAGWLLPPPTARSAVVAASLAAVLVAAAVAAWRARGARVTAA